MAILPEGTASVERILEKTAKAEETLASPHQDLEEEPGKGR
jgi:hypothetical protein